MGLGMARVEVLCLFLINEGDWRLACLRTMGDISTSNPSRFSSSVEDFAKALTETSDSESEVLMSLMSSNFNFNCNFGLNTESESESESLGAGENSLSSIDMLKSSLLLFIDFLRGLSVFLSRNLFCPRAMFTTSFVKSQFVHVCTLRQHEHN